MAAERILSEEQVARFHRDGYLLVRGMYASDEVAELAAFLCSDAAASITGTVLPMDGGWSAK